MKVNEFLWQQEVEARWGMTPTSRRIVALCLLAHIHLCFLTLLCVPFGAHDLRMRYRTKETKSVHWFVLLSLLFRHEAGLFVLLFDMSALTAPPSTRIHLHGPHGRKRLILECRRLRISRA